MFELSVILSYGSSSYGELTILLLKYSTRTTRRIFNCVTGMESMQLITEGRI